MVKVTAAEAQKFAQVWTSGGVAIPMQPIYFQFAADFANVVLQNFINQANKAQQAQIQKAAATKATEIVVDTLTPRKREEPL